MRVVARKVGTHQIARYQSAFMRAAAAGSYEGLDRAGEGRGLEYRIGEAHWGNLGGEI